MADDPTILCRPGDERFELVYFPNRIIVRTHEQISKPGEFPVRTRPVDRVYVPDAEPKTDALRYLADPENWLGDPLDQTSTLHGHFTPYELARDALTGS